MRQQQLLMSGIELVAVGEATLAKAHQRITGCAACSASASHSLDWLIHQVVGNGGMTEYFLSSATECPKCGAPIFERTLIDFDGKAIAALDEYKYFDVCDEEQEVVFIDEPTLLDAQSFIAACEHCSGQAEMPFDQLLDAITGCNPATTEYVICHAAKCGGCRHDVMEKTLIVTQ